MNNFLAALAKAFVPILVNELVLTAEKRGWIPPAVAPAVNAAVAQAESAQS